MSSLYFDERGKGEVIVFLHGFCESREIWSDFVKPLSEKFRILSPDLPGFGRSALPSSAFTIDNVADAVAEWIDKVNAIKPFIVGHSLGGYVALSLAERYPDKVRAISLFHSTVFADSEEKKENRNKVAKFVTEHGVLPYVETFVPGLFFDKAGPGVVETFRIAERTEQQTLVGYLQAMRDRPDRSSWWRTSKIPKLVIAGKEDAIISLAMSKEVAGIAQNVQFVELEKTGHMGIFEAKSRCQSVITRFAEELFFENSD